MSDTHIALLWFLTSRSAWEEIHEVFGDGHDFDWALADDEETGFEEEQQKPEMKYQDVGALPLKRDSVDSQSH